MINRRGVFGRLLGGIAALFTARTVVSANSSDTVRDVKISVAIEEVTEVAKLEMQDINTPPILEGHFIASRTVEIVRDDENEMIVRIINKYENKIDETKRGVKYMQLLTVIKKIDQDKEGYAGERSILNRDISQTPMTIGEYRKRKGLPPLELGNEIINEARSL